MAVFIYGAGEAVSTIPVDHPGRHSVDCKSTDSSFYGPFGGHRGADGHVDVIASPGFDQITRGFGAVDELDGADLPGDLFAMVTDT